LQFKYSGVVKFGPLVAVMILTVVFTTLLNFKLRRATDWTVSVSVMRILWAGSAYCHRVIVIICAADAGRLLVLYGERREWDWIND